MKICYFPDTDSLSIRLKEGMGADVEVISNDVTLDLDSSGDVLTIDVEQHLEKPTLVA